MSKVLSDKSFKTSIVLTFLFLGIGMFFLMMGLATLGVIIFFLLPISLGVAIGALPDKRWATIGAIIAAVVFLLSLIAFGLSGAFCVLLAIPIIIPLIFLGSVITHLVDRYKKIKTNKLGLLVLPLLPFVVIAPIESAVDEGKKQFIEVKTEQVFPHTPNQVYDAIKSVDTLDAEKPYLMKFDLPVPTKCVLEKEEVGGLRTCYFDGGKMSTHEYGGGTIVERITELERGKVLKMDVIDYNLIGRNWLGFDEAIYYFNAVGQDSCKLTRISTYTSVLAPRFYWEPFEILGIEQEHEYVFNNLSKDLERMFGK